MVKPIVRDQRLINNNSTIDGVDNDSKTGKLKP